MKERDVLDRSKAPFSMVTNAVLKDRRLRAGDKSVYAILCMYADNDRLDCYPSRETIMEEAGVSDNTLRNTIRKLKLLGYIDVDRRTNHRGQATNLYVLLNGGGS